MGKYVFIKTKLVDLKRKLHETCKQADYDFDFRVKLHMGPMPKPYVEALYKEYGNLKLALNQFGQFAFGEGEIDITNLHRIVELVVFKWGMFTDLLSFVKYVKEE